MLGPWRKIVNAEMRPNPGYGKHWAVGGSYKLTYECGHVWAVKASQRIPKRSRCRTCAILMGGGVSTSFDVARRLAIEERWDAKAKLPSKTIRLMTPKERKAWSR